MNTKEQIEAEVAKIRATGNAEPLFIVPIVNKRCFAPCGVGRCICFPTVGHKWAVVDQTHFHSSMDQWFSEIKWLQDHVDSLD